ncbi:MAG: putative two-component sensor histidine kinase protein [Verrucomicrobiales bacterium]|nr:putative two-component sensor histidine kinase protein [Verrucomicrobiales bacterium]
MSETQSLDKAVGGERQRSKPSMPPHLDADQNVRDILESITDAFVMLDHQWRFAYINPPAEALLNRQREDLLGRVAWLEFEHAVGSELEAELQRALREQQTKKFETYYRPFDKWFYITAYPCRDGLSIYFNDISERKRAEIKLEDQERRFRAVFDQQYQLTALLSPDGIVEDINALALQTGGFAREEIVGRPMWETPFFAGLLDTQKMWREEIAAAVRPTARANRECTFKTRTGELRVAETAVTAVRNVRNEILFLIAEGKDITNRKQAEQRLPESELRFRMLVSQVKDFAIFMTDVNGRPTSWNEGVERILHYTENEFIGSDPGLAFTPEDNAAHVPQQEFKTAAERGAASDDRWMMRKGQQRFWAAGMTTAVRDADGQLVGFSKVFRDWTAQKKMEDELREAQKESRRYADELEMRVAERTAKLRETVSELEAFSYSVSHDLRAPLRAMQGFSQFLLSDYGHVLDDTGRDYAQRITNAAARLDHLIQDILTYSRVARTQIQLRPVDLERLIREVLQAYPTLQPPNAEIQINGPLLKVLAHEPSMMQCISNLMGNAAKFVPRGTTPHITISTDRCNDRVRVWICDNGIGVAPEHQQRIFRMFETAHQAHAYEGTGIGLAIVRKAVERMGGEVGVESQPGQGSRFWIELQEAT